MEPSCKKILFLLSYQHLLTSKSHSVFHSTALRVVIYLHIAYSLCI